MSHTAPGLFGSHGRTKLSPCLFGGQGKDRFSGVGTLGPFPAILSLTVCTSLLSLGNVGLPRGTGARCEVHLLGHISDCLDMDMDENSEAEFT